MPNFCAVYKCGHNSARDKEYSYFRIPKVIMNQGEETKLLSIQRRQQWLKNVHRAKHDLTEKKVECSRICSEHFVSGKISNFIRKAT